MGKVGQLLITVGITREILLMVKWMVRTHISVILMGMCLSVRLLIMNLKKASIPLSKPGNTLSAHSRMGNLAKVLGMTRMAIPCRKFNFLIFYDIKDYG